MKDEQKMKDEKPASGAEPSQERNTNGSIDEYEPITFCVQCLPGLQAWPAPVGSYIALIIFEIS